MVMTTCYVVERHEYCMGQLILTEYWLYSCEETALEAYPDALLANHFVSEAEEEQTIQTEASISGGCYIIREEVITP